MSERETGYNPEGNEQTKKIEIVERSAIDDTHDKLNLTLLVLDKKSAADLSYTDATDPESIDEIKRIVEKEVQSRKEVLEKLSFPYHIGEVEEIRRDADIIGIGCNIIVASNEENLNKVMDSASTNDEEKFGRLMGFPETAIQSYIKGESIDVYDLPKDKLLQLKSEELLPFVTFALSPEHTEEELEFVKKRQQLIKERAPQLYRELVNGYNFIPDKDWRG